jgi:tripartite-type tricarboxylate transporter receptor subunit TctC
MTSTTTTRVALATVFAIFGTGSANGQSGAEPAYPLPGKGVRIVAPYAPGSSLDRTARHFAEKLNNLWGSPVVVENRPGAGGVVGAEYVSKATPDGYTVMMGNSSLTIATNQMAAPPYDIEKDFAAVSLVAYVPYLLVVKHESPLRNLADYIAAGKRPNASVTYGTPGERTVLHIFGEALKRSANVNMAMVAYKGEVPAMTDLLGGHIDSSFASVSLARPLIEGGRVRAIAVTSPVRSKALPDVPTFPEQGHPKLDAVPWLGLMMPAKTPAAIVSKLSSDINKIVLQPDTVKAMAEMGQEAAGMTPEQFTRFVRSERVKWNDILEFAQMAGSGKGK